MTRIFKHLSFWIVYLLFQSYIEFIWIKSSYASISEWSRFLIALKVELSLIVPKLMFTYGSTIILLSFYSTKQLTELITRLVGLFLLSLILYRLIIIYVILPFIYNEVEKDIYSIIRLLTASIDIIAVSGVFQVIKLYKLQLKSVQNEEQLLKAKLETELSYLKSQTNPHFLFNTLNNIYGLNKKNPTLGSDAILKLSKVLRFMIYGTQKPLIPVDEEMELIRNYIEIEQLRYSNKLELTLNYNSQQKGSSITPLILLPFVENAFKHGVAESTSNAYIFIDCNINQENELYFLVRNSKEVEAINKDSEGIGLNNVKRQLSLLYRKYSLDIVNNETMFEIKLWISLNSYESL